MSQFNVDKSLIFKELKKFLEEKNFKAVSLKISECLNKKSINFEEIILLGERYLDIKEYEIAKIIFIEILQNNINLSKVYFNLAVATLYLRQNNESVKYFQIALKDESQKINYLKSFGDLALSLKYFNYSKECFFSANEIEKNSFETNYKLALSYYYLDKLNKSLKFTRYALDLNSQSSDAWNLKGLIYSKIKNYKKALTSFQESINFQNTNLGPLYRNLSMAYIGINNHDMSKDYSLAIKYAQLSIDCDKNNYNSYNILALCFLYSRKFNEALTNIEISQKLNSVDPISYTYKGLIYKYLNDLENSELYLKKSYQLNKNKFDHYTTLAEVQLSMNNFFDGWQNYEKRDKKIKNKNVINELDTWNPKLGYKKILIWAEQGLGENILFSSILPEIISKFDSVTLIIDERLNSIFSENFKNLKVMNWESDFNKDQYNYQICLCSLGLYFRKNIQDFEGKEVSLNIKDNINFSKSKNLKCGISWFSTNPNIGNSKSINIEQLSPILNLENIDFFNIQYQTDHNLNEHKPMEYSKLLKNVNGIDVNNNLYGLLQFIKSCDFIITVSNTNAHLSASLGKPTFLLLSNGIGKLWYWANDYNEKNLWYPSIKKYLQLPDGDWSIPIKKIAQDVQNEYLNSKQSNSF
tara:strand:+ start:866 stop:2782 length:1917 start_codon:yes stop_codon:yes gene_type:complete